MMDNNVKYKGINTLDAITISQVILAIIVVKFLLILGEIKIL